MAGLTQSGDPATSIQAPADMSITKTGPDQALGGSPITYTIVISNIGGAPATNVTMTDSLVASMSLVSVNQTSGTPAYTCAGPPPGFNGTVTCTAPSVPAGASATISLVVATAPLTTGGVSNFASVQSVPADGNSTNDTASASTVIFRDTDVTISKTGPGQARSGEPFTYTIVVSNSGPLPADNVTMTDELPNGVRFVSINQASGTPAYACSGPAVGTNGTVTCTAASVPAGASATFSLVVQANLTNALVTNTATVSSDSERSTTNNTSSAATAIGLTAIPTLDPRALMLLAASLAAAAAWVMTPS
jgi:uncharacterized repeat protein (TIGR01451 family)